MESGISNALKEKQMEEFTEESNIELNHEQKQLLDERFKLTLAFSKRYQRSTAVCYLRLHLPMELLTLNKGQEKIATLLEIIITRLNRAIREIDTAIRINNTDFLILITDVTENDCNTICERIIESISETYQIDSNHVPVSSNIGVCMFPYGADKPKDLINISKSQMYESARICENHYSVFNGKLNEASYRKVLIENDLPYALKKGQLRIEYQPQYLLSEGKIYGVESLIRWNHPSLGEISPIEFIPFAEGTGIINDLFFWMFDEVCKNIYAYKNLDLKYSINVSVNQLLLDDFVGKLSNSIRRYSVSPKKITFEITENIEIYTVRKVRDILQSLKDMGFTIALDDFGNGYFSFSSFISLPFDFIKLDRDFVFSLIKDGKYKSVISTILTMAHSLYLDVIVEGIEDYDQFSNWAELGCDIIQGYFISKPIPHAELINSIKEIEGKVNSYEDEGSLADSLY